MGLEHNDGTFETNRRGFMGISLAALCGPTAAASSAPAMTHNIFDSPKWIAKCFVAVLSNNDEPMEPNILRRLFIEFSKKPAGRRGIAMALEQIALIQKGEPWGSDFLERMLQRNMQIAEAYAQEKREREEVLGRIVILLRVPGERIALLLAGESLS